MTYRNLRWQCSKTSRRNGFQSFFSPCKERKREDWMEENRKRGGQVRVCAGKIKAEVGKKSLLSSPPGGCSSCKLFIYLFPNKYHLSSSSHLSPSLIPAASSLSHSLLHMCHITSLHHRPSWFVWGFLHCSTLCHQWLFRFLHISILLRFNNREISVVLLISHFSLYLLELTPTALN